MKYVSWILLICLIVGAFVVGRVALRVVIRLLLFWFPLCAALLLGYLVYRSLKQRNEI
jgi:hypothetical protein